MNNNSNTPTSSPMKGAIQKKLEKPKLNQAQIESLQGIQNSFSSDLELDSGYRATRPSYKKLLSSVASLAFVFCVMFYFNSYIKPEKDIKQEIAAEVVKNHLRLKPLDIETNSITGIRQFFTQLDFQPLQSNYFNATPKNNTITMIGGRYCSIKGITAAQLRFQNQNHGLQTLYQVNYEAARFGRIPDREAGEKPSHLSLNGLDVEMWTEKGLLMVSVTNP